MKGVRGFYVILALMMLKCRYSLLFLLVLALASPALADDGKYLKYQRLLAIADDSAKCAGLMRYAETLSDSLQDYDFALLIFGKVNTLLEQKPHPGLRLDLYAKWGLTSYRKGNYEEADKLFMKALAMKELERNPALKAKILNRAGANLQNLAAYKRALVYFNEALAIYVKLNDDNGKAMVYQNIANIFALSGDLSESDKFMDKAAALFLQTGQTENYATVIGNKAYIRSQLADYEGTKAFLLQALKIPLGTVKAPDHLIARHFNLALAYAELSRWDSCFFYLEKGKKIADSLEVGAENEGSYYFNTGYCYKLKGDNAKAIDYYKKALSIRTGIANYGALYSNIASAYLDDKKYDSAFVYKELSARLADSIYKSELKQHIAFENKRVELLEKDYANEIQSSLQKQSLRQLKNRNFLFVIIIILLIAFLILLFLYFRQYRIRIKKEHLQSELDFLKAQLNPHFLFNSINSIYVLLDENKEQASEILLKFSSLMRYQLYECNVGAIPLGKELHFLEDYIAFEKLRYGEKVKVDCRFDHAEADRLLIAPLLLQPFIENAFKHIPKSRQGQSTISVSGQISGNDLLFEVTNTLNTAQASTLPGGIGLGNVRKRLSLLYPGKHTLYTGAEDKLFRITLNITLENA